MEVLTVNGNELRLFWTKAFPLLILLMSRILHTSISLLQQSLALSTNVVILVYHLKKGIMGRIQSCNIFFRIFKEAFLFVSPVRGSNPARPII